MSFGSYSLYSLGKGLYTFNDVPEAYEELMKVCADDTNTCIGKFAGNDLTSLEMYRKLRKQRMISELRASRWISLLCVVFPVSRTFHHIHLPFLVPQKKAVMIDTLIWDYILNLCELFGF